MRARRIAIFAATLAAAPSPARAQSGVMPTAAARALYDRAVEAMNDKDFEAACPKLEEAVKLEPEALGAKLKLGECYEQLGKLASAWTTYLQVEGAASKLSQDARRRRAHEAAEALGPKLATVVVEVRDEVRDLEGLRIKLDGTLLNRPLWGVPVPADRGEHVIEASATGKKTLKKVFEVVADGERLTLRLPSWSADQASSRPPEHSRAPIEPERRGPTVEIISDDPRLRPGLYRLPGRQLLCDAPCVEAIDADGEPRFYIGGNGITPSRAFRLDPSRAHVSLFVSPGKRGTRSAGGWLLGIGLTGMLFGALMMGGGAAADRETRALAVPFGGVTMAIAGGLTLLGIPLFFANGTSVSIR